MLWRDANGHEMLGAKVVDGKAVRFSIGAIAPIIVWDRTPWYKNLGLAAAAALPEPRGPVRSPPLFWPVRALVRRRYGATLELERRELLGLSRQPDRGGRDPRHA